MSYDAPMAPYVIESGFILKLFCNSGLSGTTTSLYGGPRFLPPDNYSVFLRPEGCLQ